MVDIATDASVKPASHPKPLRVGLDIGSTTVKAVVLDQSDSLGDTLFSDYRRHHANVRATVAGLLVDIHKKLVDLGRGDEPIRLSITGSGGLALADNLHVPFIQEVIAETEAIDKEYPQADVIIELGGEDAKITYLKPTPEQRMNGSCAGGTGAFIDQMSTLLDTDAAGLNEMAKSYENLYPIASRCGVFAKTDLQPLINDGAAKPDLAASIFTAVATQTIAGLASGRPIHGTVIFLGGPLFFMSELRAAFQRALEGKVDEFIVPTDAHLYVAYGSALQADTDSDDQGHHFEAYTCDEILKRLDELKNLPSNTPTMPPLFPTEADREDFNKRHHKEHIHIGTLEGAHGPHFLGIDAGSTTIKATLVNDDREIVWSSYANNEGSPLTAAINIVKKIQSELPEGAWIARSCATGYGEGLITTGLHLDEGVVETMAHYRGAEMVSPGVTAVIDIGGQDMKYLAITDGVIDSIAVNEACSSGCGSFLQTFAMSMGLTIQEFTQKALASTHPVDLGSRCTVFMNSSVKQAQKEGASIEDIAAGLCYSVVRNALYKVIKLRDSGELGDTVVVQGGTFLNDAVLRAFELLTEREVTRPNIAGLMGAFGAALTARMHYEDIADDDNAHVGADGRSVDAAAAEESAAGDEPNAAAHAGEIVVDGVRHTVSSILTGEALNEMSMTTERDVCKLCQNHCKLTITTFSDGSRFVTGNRCERGGDAKKKRSDRPNLYDYKYKRCFAYRRLTDKNATRGETGIPRALNMYENYPFWHAFFTKLGFRVVLSDQTNGKTYEAGIESMPSESVCYPAKLSHGHIMNLIAKDPDFIWMPCIRWERKEDEGATNHYNCPIVMSYPQALELNVDELGEGTKVEFLDPFIPYDKKSELKRRLYELISEQREKDAAEGRGRVRGTHITRAEIDEAVNAAWQADVDFHNAMHRKGDEALRWIEEHDAHGIVLAGRPYHNDPEINHAIPELVHSFGFAVLTEDSVAHKMLPERPIRVVDQWMFHSRLYRAARFVATRNDLDLIQLFSFGCGLDALTTDEVQEILEASGKIYTMLKVDQVSNLGAARIRIRSLMAALKEQREELERKSAAGQICEVAPEGVVCADGTPERARKDEPGRVPVYRESASAAFKKVRYTKEMQDAGYTILAPQMSPIHFELVEELLKNEGFNAVLLPSVDQGAVDMGLKYVNNDICYPSILVTGQIMEAVLSGKYDLSRTAVLITQTGGGCRATNYIALIRKALKDSGHPEVPVISLTAASGLDEDNSGFNIFKPELLVKALYALLYGDLIMQLLYRVRPYEAEAGSADALYDRMMAEAKGVLLSASRRSFYGLCQRTVDAFEALPLVNDRSKPRVGVVGEILVKFHPTANNQVVRVIEQEGCEANVPGLVDFFLFGMTNAINMKDELGTKATSRFTHKAGIKLIEGFREPINKMLEASTRFEPYPSVWELAEKAGQVLSLCNTMGEGWLLTAEMCDLIETGTPNIVCCSPFACLPNHVVGKAVIKRLREMHPESNIVAVDYDPGASEVNQLNRIKLMISVAKENYRNNRGEGFKLEGDPEGGDDFGLPLTPEQREHLADIKARAAVD